MGKKKNMKKVILYVHGKGGSHLEVEQYRDICKNFDMIGVEYEVDYPWIVETILKEVYDKAAKKYDLIYVIANSIGAYFTMNTLQYCKLEKAMFISPILNMEKLICDMMMWANVTEQELSLKKEIATSFGEVLSWEYLTYVRENPIDWNVPTSVLYAGCDNMTSRDTVDEFVKRHNADLKVMDNGEHWFHTEEQLEFLNCWLTEVINKIEFEGD